MVKAHYGLQAGIWLYCPFFSQEVIAKNGLFFHPSEDFHADIHLTYCQTSAHSGSRLWRQRANLHKNRSVNGWAL